MALNRFSASILKRSEGKNAIARAAYNARCALEDERTGQKWDFRKKGGLEFEKIFAPSNAPSWATDRQRLWQTVENGEDLSKHKATAQLARDFKISLPHELNKAQREKLITDFVVNELVSQGMVADVCVHYPDKDNDDRNYHVHVLATLRSIDRSGFGNKNRDWNEKDFLNALRQKWSEYGAKALDRAGYKLEAERFTYGHLKLSEQRREAIARGDREHAENLDREATRPVGPNGKAMEEDGIKTTRSRHNDETRERNDQRRWDRDVKRDTRKRGPVAERIFTAYRETGDAREFRRHLEKDGLFVARVTPEDIKLYGPDYSNPREELERYKWLQKGGAWLTGKNGTEGLAPDQVKRARDAFKRYNEGLDDEGRKNTFTFEGYVKYVQLQTERRIEHLAEYAKVLDFADGGQKKKSSFHAKPGEYVVLTKGGHVYRLNQATTGDTPSEVKEYMKLLDDKPIRSVAETREHLEAMRTTDRRQKASLHAENARNRHRKPILGVADKTLDTAFKKTEAGLKLGTNTITKGFSALATAMGSVADMFTNFFPNERKKEALLRESYHEEYGRER